MTYKQYSYYFTEVAESDLDEILDYIANELVNAEAAVAFADEREKRIIVLRVIYQGMNQDKILKSL